MSRSPIVVVALVLAISMCVGVWIGILIMVERPTTPPPCVTTQEQRALA